MAEASSDGRAPASSQYWIRMVEKPPSRYDRLFGAFLLVLDILTVWMPIGREPRFWILVGRMDAEQGVGVATAVRRKGATRLLEAVQDDLRGLTVDEFRLRYGLQGDDPPRGAPAP